MSSCDLYVETCLKLCLQDDYLDRKSVKAHNRAMDRLTKPETELTEHEFQRLLRYADERVRLNAAAACVRRRLCLEEAVTVLRTLGEKSEDGSIAFSAEMVLKTML